MEPLIGVPGGVRARLQRLLRPGGQEPALYLRAATPRRTRVRPAGRSPRRRDAGRRLGRPRQRPHHGDDGRPPGRARRRQRPPRRVRLVPRCPAPPPTTSRSTSAWSTHPAAGCSTRWSPTAPRAGRPHPRRPVRGRSTGGGARDQLRPRHAPRQGTLRWWPGAGSAGPGGSVAPCVGLPPTPPGCTCPPGSVPPPIRSRALRGRPGAPCSPFWPATPEGRPSGRRTDFGAHLPVGYPRVSPRPKGRWHCTGCGATGARRSGRRGRRFKSCHPDHCRTASKALTGFR